MADLILHHYPTSPFSEKVRAILGYKKLAWKSVHTPTIMPKPDLIALTGGYRRAPVLQIGADIYCDSKLIARVIDRIQPQPPLIPKGTEASCSIIEQWSETLFFLTVPVVLRPQGMALFFGKLPPGAAEEFQKDRKALFTGGSGRRPSRELTESELPAALAQMETQLAAAPFILGNTPSLADFSLQHAMWFIHANPGVKAHLEPYPRIRDWTERIMAFGQGEAEKMSGEDALKIARSSEPAGISGTSSHSQLQPGAAITVSATDYGTDPVTGVLAKADMEEIVLLREDPRAGRVAVHFPRTGFRLAAA
ncbi:MAG: glutathione S-transferase family protein [Stenotrophobium sp.]